MRKLIVFLSGSILVVFGGSVFGVYPQAFAGIAIGLGLGFSLMLLASGVRTGFGNVMYQTRLDERILSVEKSSMPVLQLPDWLDELEIPEDLLTGGSENSDRNPATRNRHFERVEEMPRMEILMEIVP